MTAFYDTNLVLIQGTLVAVLLALSVQIPLRFGIFSLAGVGSYGIGAYLSANLVLRYELASVPAIVLTGLVTAVVGLVLGLVIYRLAGLYLAMATIAFDLMVAVVALNGGEWTGGPVGLFGIFSDLTTGLMLAIVGICLLAVHLTERGRLARRITVVREDTELASSVGVNVRAYRLSAFVVSGFVGGVAGSLNTLTRYAVGLQDVSFHLVIVALTMIIVGGALSWRGAVIGAILFTWLPEALAVVGDWQELVYGVVVALAGIFLPTGLYGLLTRARRGYAARRRAVPARSRATATDVATEEELRHAATSSQLVPDKRVEPR
ncbi:branched-chain amino acid ABC transporter permease [Nocardioides sp. LHG3406-4]|uniref:branched-chain amino acid ABC transporter permease n=1 Tax=Nocardioides sp. LHG3406-4 TaxID=2804575 RepID=UPI003CEA91BD